MKTIDCRNMACPRPVIETKKALAEHTALRILLDDGAARENVTRFLQNRGCSVSETADGDSWALIVHTTGDAGTPAVVEESPRGACSFLITSDRLGDGPEDLGRLLMKNFIATLLECETLPQGIYFMNSGVRLTCSGSDALEALIRLENLGVEIRSCGLCLDFFQLKPELRAGTITNMLTTAENLLHAAKVIKL